MTLNEKFSNIINDTSFTNIKLLFFMFFNLSDILEKDGKSFFKFSISYKKIQKIKEYYEQEDVALINNENFENYLSLKLSFQNFTHKLLIENDKKLTKQEFFEEIYKKILVIKFNDKNFDIDLFEKSFVLGLFAFRGSPDFNGKFFSVDILERNLDKNYMKKFINLLLTSNWVENLNFNFNFRNLQPDYNNRTRNKKRNPQVRVKLDLFWHKYKSDLEKLNIAKAYCMDIELKKIQLNKNTNNTSNDFLARVLFYANYFTNENGIVQIDEKKVDEYREQLNFNITSNSTNNKEKETQRNQQLVEFARIQLPDFCFGCKDRFDLLVRTFYRKNSNVPYLEIHHTIPFSQDPKNDTIENLVKLCPVCHKALTKNRSNENEQKNIIKSILKFSHQTAKFIQETFKDQINKTKENIVDFIFSKLV